MVCFGHDDDSSKNIEKNDNCLERTLIGPVAVNNLEETPSTETERALSALCVPRNNSNIPESLTKLASNSEAQLGPTTASLNNKAQLGPSTASVVTPAKEKGKTKMSQMVVKKHQRNAHLHLLAVQNRLSRWGKPSNMLQLRSCVWQAWTEKKKS